MANTLNLFRHGAVGFIDWLDLSHDNHTVLLWGKIQFTFAFGPSLLGEIEYLSGGYGAALLACLAMQVIAAVVVVVLKGHSPRG